MRYISSFAATAALVSLAAASDAPMAENTNIGITFTATLPNTGKITGSILGAGAPDGTGSNFQVALYNLPQGSNFTYGIMSGKAQDGNCASAGGLLNPFAGVTGADCTPNNMAACQIGDLSGKHGNAVLQTGGAGTGYFSANFVDSYLSTDDSSQAFFGDKAIVIMDANGAAMTCANFVSSAKQLADARNSTATASPSSGMATMTAASGASASASAPAAGNAAPRTAAVGYGAAVGVAGLVALLL